MKTHKTRLMHNITHKHIYIYIVITDERQHLPCMTEYITDVRKYIYYYYKHDIII